MTNSQRLQTIRNRLLTWIAASTDDHRIEKVIRETVLIRDDFFVGRRFYTEAHSAVWFIEEDKLKIFDTDNQLLCVLSTPEIDAAEIGSAEMDHQPSVIKMPALRDDRDHGDDINTEVRRAA